MNLLSAMERCYENSPRTCIIRSGNTLKNTKISKTLVPRIKYEKTFIKLAKILLSKRPSENLISPTISGPRSYISSLSDISESDVPLAVFLAGIRICLVLPGLNDFTFNNTLWMQNQRSERFLHRVESWRRKYLERIRIFAQPSLETVNVKGKGKRDSHQRDLMEIDKISVEIQKSFESAVLGLRRQLVIQKLFVTPFDPNVAIRTLKYIFPNRRKNQSDDSLAFEYYTVKELEFNIANLIHQCEIAIVNFRKNQNAEIIRRISTNSTELLGSIEVSSKSELTFLKEFKPLMDFYNELPWEDARAAVLKYLDTIEHHISEELPRSLQKVGNVEIP
ncbi:hypothetical protein HK096_004284 [Nowakowskiella sp. JEL0078]|nr:hypothetical protein HK096_004284 [Nowakowskiella sp. JEL0078]